MSKKTKQEFDVTVIKTPDGQVPTVESFHSVVDGLFGEVLDTRKDIAKLIPNLEKELDTLREILAQQMVLFEVMNNTISNLEKQVKEQDKLLQKILQEQGKTKEQGLAEVELTSGAQKAIAKLIRTGIKKETKPISEALAQLETKIQGTEAKTLTKVEKDLGILRDKIDDLSSKTELQMLEILESVNQRPGKSSSNTKSRSKKKLTS